MRCKLTDDVLRRVSGSSDVVVSNDESHNGKLIVCSLNDSVVYLCLSCSDYVLKIKCSSEFGLTRTLHKLISQSV